MRNNLIYEMEIERLDNTIETLQRLRFKLRTEQIRNEAKKRSVRKAVKKSGWLSRSLNRLAGREMVPMRSGR